MDLDNIINLLETSNLQEEDTEEALPNLLEDDVFKESVGESARTYNEERADLASRGGDFTDVDSEDIPWYANFGRFIDSTLSGALQLRSTTRASRAVGTAAEEGYTLRAAQTLASNKSLLADVRRQLETSTRPALPVGIGAAVRILGEQRENPTIDIDGTEVSRQDARAILSLVSDLRQGKTTFEGEQADILADMQEGLDKAFEDHVAALATAPETVAELERAAETDDLTELTPTALADAFGMSSFISNSAMLLSLGSGLLAGSLTRSPAVGRAAAGLTMAGTIGPSEYMMTYVERSMEEMARQGYDPFDAQQVLDFATKNKEFLGKAHDDSLVRAATIMSGEAAGVAVLGKGADLIKGAKFAKKIVENAKRSRRAQRLMSSGAFGADLVGQSLWASGTEATAQLVSDQAFSWLDVGLEGILEVPMNIAGQAAMSAVDRIKIARQRYERDLAYSILGRDLVDARIEMEDLVVTDLEGNERAAPDDSLLAGLAAVEGGEDTQISFTEDVDPLFSPDPSTFEEVEPLLSPLEQAQAAAEERFGDLAPLGDADVQALDEFFKGRLEFRASLTEEGEEVSDTEDAFAANKLPSSGEYVSYSVPLDEKGELRRTEDGSLDLAPSTAAAIVRRGIDPEVFYGAKAPGPFRVVESLVDTDLDGLSWYIRQNEAGETVLTSVDRSGGKVRRDNVQAGNREQLLAWIAEREELAALQQEAEEATDAIFEASAPISQLSKRISDTANKILADPDAMYEEYAANNADPLSKEEWLATQDPEFRAKPPNQAVAKLRPRIMRVNPMTGQVFGYARWNGRYRMFELNIFSDKPSSDQRFIQDPERARKILNADPEVDVEITAKGTRRLMNKRAIIAIRNAVTEAINPTQKKRTASGARITPFIPAFRADDNFWKNFGEPIEVQRILLRGVSTKEVANSPYKNKAEFVRAKAKENIAERKRIASLMAPGTKPQVVADGLARISELKEELASIDARSIDDAQAMADEATEFVDKLEQFNKAGFLSEEEYGTASKEANAALKAANKAIEDAKEEGKAKDTQKVEQELASVERRVARAGGRDMGQIAGDDAFVRSPANKYIPEASGDTGAVRSFMSKEDIAVLTKATQGKATIVSAESISELKKELAAAERLRDEAEGLRNSLYTDYPKGEEVERKILAEEGYEKAKAKAEKLTRELGRVQPDMFETLLTGIQITENYDVRNLNIWFNAEDGKYHAEIEKRNGEFLYPPEQLGPVNEISLPNSVVTKLRQQVEGDPNYASVASREETTEARINSFKRTVAQQEAAARKREEAELANVIEPLTGEQRLADLRRTEIRQKSPEDEYLEALTSLRQDYNEAVIQNLPQSTLDYLQEELKKLEGDEGREAFIQDIKDFRRRSKETVRQDATDEFVQRTEGADTDGEARLAFNRRKLAADNVRQAVDERVSVIIDEVFSEMVDMPLALKRQPATARELRNEIRDRIRAEYPEDASLPTPSPGAANRSAEFAAERYDMIQKMRERYQTDPLRRQARQRQDGARRMREGESVGYLSDSQIREATDEFLSQKYPDYPVREVDGRVVFDPQFRAVTADELVGEGFTQSVMGQYFTKSGEVRLDVIKRALGVEPLSSLDKYLSGRTVESIDPADLDKMRRELQAVRGPRARRDSDPVIRAFEPDETETRREEIADAVLEQLAQLDRTANIRREAGRFEGALQAAAEGRANAFDILDATEGLGRLVDEARSPAEARIMEARAETGDALLQKYAGRPTVYTNATILANRAARNFSNRASDEALNSLVEGGIGAQAEIAGVPVPERMIDPEGFTPKQRRFWDMLRDASRSDDKDVLKQFADNELIKIYRDNPDLIASLVYKVRRGSVTEKKLAQEFLSRTKTALDRFEALMADTVAKLAEGTPEQQAEAEALAEEYNALEVLRAGNVSEALAAIVQKELDVRDNFIAQVAEKSASPEVGLLTNRSVGDAQVPAFIEAMAKEFLPALTLSQRDVSKTDKDRSLQSLDDQIASLTAEGVDFTFGLAGNPPKRYINRTTATEPGWFKRWFYSDEALLDRAYKHSVQGLVHLSANAEQHKRSAEQTTNKLNTLGKAAGFEVDSPQFQVAFLERLKGSSPQHTIDVLGKPFTDEMEEVLSDMLQHMRNLTAVVQNMGMAPNNVIRGISNNGGLYIHTSSAIAKSFSRWTDALRPTPQGNIKRIKRSIGSGQFNALVRLASELFAVPSDPASVGKMNYKALRSVFRQAGLTIRLPDGTTVPGVELAGIKYPNFEPRIGPDGKVSKESREEMSDLMRRALLDPSRREALGIDNFEGLIAEQFSSVINRADSAGLDFFGQGQQTEFQRQRLFISTRRQIEEIMNGIIDSNNELRGNLRKYFKKKDGKTLDKYRMDDLKDWFNAEWQNLSGRERSAALDEIQKEFPELKPYLDQQRKLYHFTDQLREAFQESGNPKRLYVDSIIRLAQMKSLHENIPEFIEVGLRNGTIALKPGTGADPEGMVRLVPETSNMKNFQLPPGSVPGQPEGLTDLTSVYATPLTAQVFQSITGLEGYHAGRHPLYQLFGGVSALAKTGLIIQNLYQMPRNLVSTMWLAAKNAAVYVPGVKLTDLRSSKIAFSMAGRDLASVFSPRIRDNMDEFTTNLTRAAFNRRILGDSVRIGTVQDNIRRMAGADDSVSMRVLEGDYMFSDMLHEAAQRRMRETGLYAKLKRGAIKAAAYEQGFMEELFRLGDETGKMMRWLTESRAFAEILGTDPENVFTYFNGPFDEEGRYAGGLPSDTVEVVQQALDIGARSTMDTMPTFSRLSRFVRAANRNVFTGAFVGFPAEILRNNVMAARQRANMIRGVLPDGTYVESKAGRAKMAAWAAQQLGAQASLGMFASYAAIKGALIGAGAIGAVMSGDADDEDEVPLDVLSEDARHLAHWYEGSNNLTTPEVDEDGNVVYYDLSFTHGEGWLMQAIEHARQDAMRAIRTHEYEEHLGHDPSDVALGAKMLFDATHAMAEGLFLRDEVVVGRFYDQFRGRLRDSRYRQEWREQGIDVDTLDALDAISDAAMSGTEDIEGMRKSSTVALAGAMAVISLLPGNVIINQGWETARLAMEGNYTQAAMNFSGLRRVERTPDDIIQDNRRDIIMFRNALREMNSMLSTELPFEGMSDRQLQVRFAEYQLVARDAADRVANRMSTYRRYGAPAEVMERVEILSNPYSRANPETGAVREGANTFEGVPYRAIIDGRAEIPEPEDFITDILSTERGLLDRPTREAAANQVVNMRATVLQSGGGGGPVKDDPELDQLIVDEGMEEQVYLDTKGIPTVGIGINLNEHRDKVEAMGYALVANPDFGLDPSAPPEILDRPLTEADAKAISSDIVRSYREQVRQRWPDLARLNPEVENILTNMAFNMGVEGLAGFPSMLSALFDGPAPDYQRAADEMGLNSSGTGPSQWVQDTGNRAYRLIERMRRLQP